MRQSNSIIIGVIVLAIVIGGLVFIFSRPSTNSATQTTTSSSPSPSPSSEISPSPTPPTSTAHIITYSDSGFSPSTITVQSGDSITIKNQSSQGLQFDSDPHPIHTDDTDLNVGTVAPGGDQTFTVSKKGTFGYHNHLAPSDRGTIIIK